MKAKEKRAETRIEKAALAKKKRNYLSSKYMKPEGMLFLENLAANSKLQGYFP